MAYRVEILPGALADAEEALLWWREHAPSRADDWYNGLLAAIYSLEEFPGRCPVARASETLGVEVRQLLYGKRPGIYRIYFRVVGNSTVRVLRIRHGARDALPHYDPEG